MLKKYGDFIAGLCGMALAAYIFITGYQIGLAEGKDFGAGFLPKLVATGLFICCAILTYRGFKTMYTVKAEQSEYKKNYLGAYGIFIMMVIYALCMKPVGFVISSAVFLFCAILLATKRENWKPIMFAVISVVLVLAVYFVFKDIFGIRLPNGVLDSIF